MAVLATRVAVDVTATQLVVANGIPSSTNRASTVIYNNGPNLITVGGDNTVTLANGFIVPAGASLTIDHDTADELWAIGSVLQVTPANTCVLVETKS